MIDEARTCRVLAIDGGGIRGVIPATILAYLEQAVGGPLASKFHLIAGTSTGGILASGLAHEIPTAKLTDFYFKDGPGIFNAAFLGSVDGPKYAPAALEASLRTAFGDTRLSQLRHDLACPAYDINARTDFIFKSWKARGIEEPSPLASDFLVREVARATSAAPTYFPPAVVTAGDGKKYPLIDGGMYGNNPALIGFVAARRLMPLATRFLVVSIGTGSSSAPIAYSDATQWGVIGWGPTLLDIIFDSMGGTVEYELDQLEFVSQLRLQSSLQGASDAMDDTSLANMNALAACATRTLTARSTDIGALIAELKMPLADRTKLGYPSASDPPRPSTIHGYPSKLKPIVMPSQLAAIVPASASADTAWKLGGAAAGALAGFAVAGPVGAVIGGVAGAVGGTIVAKESQ